MYVYYYSGSTVLSSSFMSCMKDEAREYASEGLDFYVLRYAHSVIYKGGGKRMFKNPRQDPYKRRSGVVHNLS